MRRLLFAANWKMHLGPRDADAFFKAFLDGFTPAADGREIWFFPPAVSLEAVRRRIDGRPGFAAGLQHVFWETQGAFTGEISVPMAAQAGARAVLVGHSERRHVFGETDDDCRRKVAAALAGGLTPVLCVGETLEQREAGDTIEVVRRQLGVLRDQPEAAGRIVIAYEPVWAIGTGRTATPADAAEVHAAIRQALDGCGLDGAATRVLYGGSVKPGNVEDLLAERELDGVLVGGASLDPAQWRAIVATTRD